MGNSEDDKKFGGLASKGRLQGKKNGMRGTILKESSLTYPWNILGTKSLPMGRCDPNWIHTTTIGYCSGSMRIGKGKVQGYG
jgi:hypothetical protein